MIIGLICIKKRKLLTKERVDIKMGNMFVFSAIEQEEKALRMQEDRNNIYEQINEIEDI